MCLHRANQIYPTKDITCYKVVVSGRSPYQAKKWKVGKLESLKRPSPQIDPDDCSVPGQIKIRGGAYHTYVDLKDAKDFADSIVCSYGSSVKVLECIIPKSSKYVYTGSLLFGRNGGYASQKLKPVRVV